VVGVRRGRHSVSTYSTRSGECRYVLREVGLVSGLVRGCRLSVGT